ncbi:MAG TPA: hypothetical protein VHP11_09540 [Tepidisphaeraceae bacterium]|nr:hypothetical protein [Tepidisphaeraceae bacterium]
MRLSILTLIASLGLFCAGAFGQGKGPDDELSPAAIQQRILQYRTAETTLTLSNVDGKPLANVPVTIRQVRHKFLFGCNGFGINPADASELQKGYHQQFADLLNFATLGFYWGTFEPMEGKPNTQGLRRMAAWCKENHIVTKGHPLCWQQVYPRWLLNRPVIPVCNRPENL